MATMTVTTVDEYLATLDEPKRTTLQTVRDRVREILPNAEEGLTRGVPMYRVGGKSVAGFVAFKAHLTYSPQSAEVMTALADELAGFAVSKASFQFPVDAPLETTLLRHLIEARLAQLGLG